ncbi:hypothetical protein [Vibrio diazotrophicus]|uniref:hypothetical protein n=1 Tax=Vibrio diazotrophicus TaxID=685 RepID=UPI000C9E0333|nr:hypothetical protein [Vibrio diazotrophicus]PNH87406.1 hypothetical protein C1M59_21610 [Vibrio diazotrophicus]
MTTFLVDSQSGACDSLWTDKYDIPAIVDLDKYLFIEELDEFETPIQEKIGHEKIIFYSGCYDQIVLHQALTVGILNEAQYSIQAQNAVALGNSAFSYVEIILQTWEPYPVNCLHAHGLIAGGSGGNHAIHAYVETTYNTKLAVEEACKLDPKSSEPVTYFHHNASGNYTSENCDKIGVQNINNIYSKAEELILSMQSGERGGLMDKVKYSGYTTAPSPEAPPINISQVLEQHHMAKMRTKQLRVRRNPKTSSKEKIVVKPLAL